MDSYHSGSGYWLRTAPHLKSDYNRPYHSMPNPNPLIAQKYHVIRTCSRELATCPAVDQADVPRRRTTLHTTQGPWSRRCYRGRGIEGMYGIMPPPGSSAGTIITTCRLNLFVVGCIGNGAHNSGGHPIKHAFSESPFRDFPQVQQRSGYHLKAT
jgi:hypothetical protein